jgi:hypothetical protein
MAKSSYIDYIGGSWFTYRVYCKAMNRGRWLRDGSDYIGGFRLMLLEVHK